jgi:hypothetical protein
MCTNTLMLSSKIENKNNSTCCKELATDICNITYLLASSSRTLTSNSLLGGYFGKLDGSQGRGFVVKNCKKAEQMKINKTSRSKLCQNKLLVNREEYQTSMSN